jgi:choline-sulfatase
MSNKPNFVFFMLDQLRADSIGTFGESIVQTPNFDKLASEGAAFANCFVQHSVCTPSRCSIMTGWYPHVNGHRTLNYLLQPHEPNLLKYLHENGYHIEWYGKNDLLVKESFDQSVDNRKKILNGDKTYIPNPWPKDSRLHQSFYYGEKSVEFIRDHDYECVQNSIEFIENRPEDKPFFLYLPLIYPHPPYNVEEPYFTMYDRKKVPLPAKADFSTKPKFVERYHKLHRIDELTQEDLREIKATYYGMITRTDDLLGQLLKTLEREGLMENTVIVILSDHGDYTGDYGLVEKWWTGLTDDLVRTPLIIKAPFIKNKGTKLYDLIESIDIFPTIMEMAGIEDYHTQFGKSLMPLINGKNDTHREYVFAEGGHHPQDKHCSEEVLEGIYHAKTYLQQEDFGYIHNAVMVRSKEWKYIKHLNDTAELYNLLKDPQEEKNLAKNEEYSGVIADMEKQLLKWYMKTCDNVPMEMDERDFF